MKDYTKFMKWAVIYVIDRTTQDDRKSKNSIQDLNEKYGERAIFHLDELGLG